MWRGGGYYAVGHNLCDVDLFIAFANQFAKCKVHNKLWSHRLNKHQLLANATSCRLPTTSDNFKKIAIITKKPAKN